MPSLKSKIEITFIPSDFNDLKKSCGNSGTKQFYSKIDSPSVRALRRCLENNTIICVGWSSNIHKSNALKAMEIVRRELLKGALSVTIAI